MMALFSQHKGIPMSHRHHGVLGAVFAAVVCSSYAVLIADTAQKNEAEPPMSFELVIDGNATPVELDKPVKVTVHGKETTIRLAAKPTRLFRKAGISFDYPRHMAFEYDDSTPGLRIWSLDGNNTVLMLLKYDMPIKPANALNLMVSQLVGQYGRSNSKVSASSIELGDSKLSGKRITASIAGEKLHQDLYAFGDEEGPWLLMVQDMPDELGKVTKETQQTIDLLQSSFAAFDVKDQASAGHGPAHGHGDR